MIDLVVIVGMLVFIAKLASGLIAGNYDFTVGEMSLLDITLYVAGVTSIVGWIHHSFYDNEES